MRIGSLFSGIGGLELGLERAGVGRTVWQCEIDPYARAVLAKHWPDAIRFEDVTKMHDVPPVDVICGGFPCQDISNAGRREGISGARSGLFFELMRVVRLVRPRFVVLENVAALLGRGMGDVLGELSESGYDAEWDCIPASAVGAPHRRDRVFIIGYVADAERDRRHGRRQQLSECGEVARYVADADQGGQPRRSQHDAGGGAVNRAECDGTQLADAEPDGCRASGRNAEAMGGTKSREEGEEPKARRTSATAVVGRPLGWNVPASRWLPEPDVGRVAHGVPSRVDRLKCLGNAVVPQVAEVVGRRLMEIARQ